MYLRSEHAEHDIPTCHSLIRNNPLGVITTAIPSPTHPLLQSSHIPWILDVPSSSPPSSSSSDLGRLRGHMARANPQTKAIIEHLQNLGSRELDTEVLVLFTSPVYSYVTPKFYIDTKPTTGKTVPTWDYAAVQVYGKAKIYYYDREDETTSAMTDEFLSKQISELSILSETRIMGYSEKEAWTVEEAPRTYVDVLKKAIIGIEIQITRMAGKWKMSQELGEGDRRGVIEGFEKMVGTETGREMARMVRERGR